jgi:hypothetical protein
MTSPETKVVQPVVELVDQADPLDVFIVVAWWHGGHWKVFRDQWLKEEAAREFCDGLPCGYTRRRIYRLTDPGALLSMKE